MSEDSHFVIRGARGTMPACGEQFRMVGGNTTCFSFQTPRGIIVFDAGTGIASLSRQIAALPDIPDVTILFTHFHMDHLIGLPCFEPLYKARARITLMADPGRHANWKLTLKTFMAPPYWPIGLGQVSAAVRMVDLPMSAGVLDLYDARITWFQAPHPQHCLAFRLQAPDLDAVVATDVEYEKDHVDPAIVEFARGCDFLIFDAQFRPDEYAAHREWGHSTSEVAALIATQAGVGRLILTHHAPERNDQEVMDIVHTARKLFPPTDAASEGMVLRRPTA